MAYKQDNSLYIDYLVMPPVSANKNAYIKDLVYNRFALIKINGELKIKILSYQNMLKIRYQMDILEGLLREKYGKSGILSLGRKLKGDNAVLIKALSYIVIYRNCSMVKRKRFYNSVTYCE